MGGSSRSDPSGIGGESNSSEKHFETGLRLISENLLEDSIQSLTFAIDKNPDHTLAFYYRSRSNYECQNYEDALNDIKEAILLHPKGKNYLRSLYHTGISLYSSLIEQSDQETIRQFKTVTPGIDIQSYAIFHRGLSYYYAKLPILAITEFTELIKRSSNYALAYFYRGLAYYAHKHYRLSSHDLKYSSELEPSYTSYYNLGLSQLNHNDYIGAIESFTKCIQFEPNDPSSYNNRGSAYRGLGHLSLAITDFSIAISLDPNYTLALFNRSRCSIDMMDYFRAIDDLTSCLKFYKSDHFYYYRAISFSKIDRTQDAIKDLKAAIDINPNDENLYAALGEMHMSKKEYGLAEMNFTKALAMNPRNYKLKRRRGSALWHQGKSITSVLGDYWSSYLINPILFIFGSMFKYV